MKKLIALLLVITLVLSGLTACRSNSKSSDSKPASTSITKIDDGVKAKEAKEKAAKTKTNKEKAAKTKTAKESTNRSNTSNDETKKTVKKNNAKYCSVYITCKNILKVKSELDEGVAKQVPSSGIILSKTKAKIKSGDTVLDVTSRIAKAKGVAVSYQGQTAYGTAYVEGIHNIFEKDCGGESGWMYSVNGTFPSKGCSAVKVSNGDAISWEYTINNGDDVR